MKCRPVRVWMLSDETPQRPPSKVRHHLQHCPRCRKRYARLVRLIHEVQKLPAPSDTSAAQARFLASLPPPPVPMILTPPQFVAPPRRRRSPARWLQAAMLLIGFGLGWLVLAALRPASKPAPLTQAPARQAPRARGLLEERILKQHLKLAETRKPAEKVQALGKMAADLRTESLRQARQGQVDEVRYLVWLYRRVVGEGVVRSAALLPAGERGVLKPVIADLLETGSEAGGLARTAGPRLVGPLRLLVVTASAAVRALRTTPVAARMEQVSADPPVELGGRSLLRVLVVQSLLVVTEEDPVRRAAHSTRVAHGLAQAILDRAATADEQEASRLGQSLEAVVNRAVNATLELVDPDDANPKQIQEMEKVRRRADAAVTAVKKKIPGMPEAARDGLQHMLRKKQATKSPHGKKKAMKSKSKKHKRGSRK